MKTTIFATMFAILLLTSCSCSTVKKENKTNDTTNFSMDKIKRDAQEFKDSLRVHGKHDLGNAD